MWTCEPLSYKWETTKHDSISSLQPVSTAEVRHWSLHGSMLDSFHLAKAPVEASTFTIGDSQTSAWGGKAEISLQHTLPEAIIGKTASRPLSSCLFLLVFISELSSTAGWTYTIQTTCTDKQITTPAYLVYIWHNNPQTTATPGSPPI